MSRKKSGSSPTKMISRISTRVQMFPGPRIRRRKRRKKKQRTRPEAIPATRPEEMPIRRQEMILKIKL